MEHNSDFKYDLIIGNIKEKQIADILKTKQIEVKYDRIAPVTHNVFVEYQCRGKPSGIATTTAEYYCFVINNTLIFVETKNLKETCRKYLNTEKDTVGGDNNLSKGILLPITELIYL